MNHGCRFLLITYESFENRLCKTAKSGRRRSLLIYDIRKTVYTKKTATVYAIAVSCFLSDLYLQNHDIVICNLSAVHEVFFE